MRQKIGILGYGQLGQFLVDKILNDPEVSNLFELSFVWNRSREKLAALPKNVVLDPIIPLPEALTKFNIEHGAPDIIVEASHPDIIKNHSDILLENSNLFITSITALADPDAEQKLRAASDKSAIYIPSGAAWGVEDIVKLEESGNLRLIKVCMSFTTESLKVREPLISKLESYKANKDIRESQVLFKGNLRELARLAPNNVNTMCCIALAAPSVGFDGLIAELIAHKQPEAHLIEIECYGHDDFFVKTSRFNPALRNAVTGNQTFHSFMSSLKRAIPQDKGIHFC